MEENEARKTESGGAVSGPGSSEKKLKKFQSLNVACSVGGVLVFLMLCFAYFDSANKLRFYNHFVFPQAITLFVFILLGSLNKAIFTKIYHINSDAEIFSGVINRIVYFVHLTIVIIVSFLFGYTFASLNFVFWLDLILK